jgi:nitrogen regulatory protein PII 1
MDVFGIKMVWAVIRPEVVDRVAKALTAGGFAAMTRFDVYGRGKQKGMMVAGENYDMPKTVLMLVVDSGSVDAVMKIIEDNARTGSIGDGRIFVAPIEEARTIRTGEPGL